MAKLEQAKINRVLGDVGEYLVQKDLECKGYYIGVYGKAMEREENPSHLAPNAPMVFDLGVGYSCLDYYPTKGYCTSDSVRIFDYSDQDILRLTECCRNHKSCELLASGTPPCILNENPFHKPSWEQKYPNVDDVCITNYLAKGYLRHCHTRLQEIALRASKYKLPIESKFTLDNQRIHRFIQVAWWKHKDGSSDYLNKFPPGHPGRYDFIAEKDGAFSAVEVKVNSSKLSHWQNLRLALLQKFGHRVIIANVEIDKCEIENILVGRAPIAYAIKYDESPKFIMAMPTKTEFESDVRSVWPWMNDYILQTRKRVNAHHSKKSQAIVAHKNPQGCLFAVAAIISAISLSGLSVILIAIHLW